MNKYTRGFSLVELMLVVAIVGIIAGIAYPSYIDSVRKARRGEAVAALLELSLAQERYRAANAAYSEDLDTLGFNNADADGVDDGLPNSETLASGFYVVAVDQPNTDATQFRITATLVGGTDQANDAGCTGVFSINQNGPDYSGANNPRTCWE